MSRGRLKERRSPTRRGNLRRGALLFRRERSYHLFETGIAAEGIPDGIQLQLSVAK